MAGIRCLVTGATSGLGQCLIPALVEQGFEVTATGRNETIGARLTARGVRFIACDLVDDPLDTLVAQSEIVFHLAALSAPFGPARDFLKANLTATHRTYPSQPSLFIGAAVFVCLHSVYIHR